MTDGLRPRHATTVHELSLGSRPVPAAPAPTELPRLRTTGRTAVIRSAIFMVAAVSVIALVMAGQPWKDAVSRRPDRFEELYFDPGTGARTTLDASGRYPVTFAIRNMGDAAVVYTFRVTVDGAERLAARSSAVGPGQVYRAAVPVQLPARPSPLLVAVTLSTGTTIHRWVTP